MHVFDVTNDIEILRAFAWLHSNRRNLCLFAQNVRRSVAHNRDNNKQTITHLAAWRISFAIRSKGKLSVYCIYTRKRTKEQCCVRNLSVEYNCTNCKWSIVTCLIMHHTTYDTPYERYPSSWTSMLLLEAETSLLTRWDPNISPRSFLTVWVEVPWYKDPRGD